MCIKIQFEVKQQFLFSQNITLKIVTTEFDPLSKHTKSHNSKASSGLTKKKKQVPEIIWQVFTTQQQFLFSFPKEERDWIITRVMGPFKSCWVTRNLFPNFSTCLDKTLTTVFELLNSSSSFSILFTNPTFKLSLRIRLHCRFRIHALTTTPPTSIRTTHKTPTLLPFTVVINTFFDEPLAARPTDTTAEENRHDNSIAERRESKLKPPPLPAVCFCTVPSDSRAFR